jgi:hypothetical protein
MDLLPAGGGPAVIDDARKRFDADRQGRLWMSDERPGIGLMIHR